MQLLPQSVRLLLQPCKERFQSLMVSRPIVIPGSAFLTVLVLCFCHVRSPSFLFLTMQLYYTPRLYQEYRTKIMYGVKNCTMASA